MSSNFNIVYILFWNLRMRIWFEIWGPKSHVILDHNRCSALLKHVVHFFSHGIYVVHCASSNAVNDSNIIEFHLFSISSKAKMIFCRLAVNRVMVNQSFYCIYSFFFWLVFIGLWLFLICRIMTFLAKNISKSYKLKL